MTYSLGVTPITIGDCVIVGWVVSGVEFIFAGLGCYLTVQNGKKGVDVGELGYAAEVEDFRQGSTYKPEVYERKQKIYSNNGFSYRRDSNGNSWI